MALHPKTPVAIAAEVHVANDIPDSPIINAAKVTAALLIRRIVIHPQFWQVTSPSFGERGFDKRWSFILWPFVFLSSKLPLVTQAVMRRPPVSSRSVSIVTFARNE